MTRATWIAKPNVWLRVGIALMVGALVAVGAWILYTMDLRMNFAQSLADALQGLEAGVNALVFFSIAILFLATLEGRIKRARALKAIHELRSIAHIIDMHQLTKDPERLRNKSSDTPSSPGRSLTSPELARYLDYCSEMLSMLSKIAAIYAEHFRDSVALSAVDEIEDLVSDLSRKIWQKIMIVVAYEERTGSLR